ncbi:thermonuclease family protein [Candidatus Bipolaricaulota bacterium]|nr:thermonuclease family protein [Candidatus Bipolaricaulota bacterium]
MIALVHAAWAQTPDTAFATMEVRCTRIVDGDTIELRGGETVRLLGIDTPELGEPYAEDAKWYLSELVAHKTLFLEFDQQLRDIYNRLLAHIYVDTEDGWVLVNAEMVRAGLAKLLFIPPNARYYGYFETALEEAVLQRRGIWGTIGGCLTVRELEEDLLSYITKMVTVEFTIGEVTQTSRHLVLYSAEGDYGFYVKVPLDLVLALEIEYPETLVGTCVVATGIVDCERVGLGPSIVLEYAEQLLFPCPETEATD